jgi:hypothetical protein
MPLPTRPTPLPGAPPLDHSTRVHIDLSLSLRRGVPPCDVIHAIMLTSAYRCRRHSDVQYARIMTNARAS